MLYKLSISNIRKSLKDYAVYFFTLIIGVSIFYVFNAVGTQTAFLKLEGDTREIAELLKTMLSGLSVFVAIILGLLVVYASRFLMKRRKKEFALYLMLGMEKGEISMILLLETLFIGLGSLATGLLIGIGLSQIMSAVVVSLFDADMTAYRFTLSVEAVLKTVIYFGIMYLVVVLFNSVVIGKCKLIDLMQSDKRSEEMKLKNPVLCVIVFFLSAGALGFAYHKVGWEYAKLSDTILLFSIALGAVSTFFIFWSVSGLFLRIIMSMKRLYFRNLNSFTFRQLSSRIHTMVFSMTVICLLLFVTICTLTSAFSLRNSMNDNLESQCPADMELMVDAKREQDEKKDSDKSFKKQDFMELCEEK
ncbi:MAG: FtsX-like permease family protein, partial [Lachnospiraceae bacterium]|nr:FtsX-like permease family protein [Lachnospiraceae bacterium]